MHNLLPDVKAIANAIAENSVQGIAVMDEAGYCLYANRAWTELTGFTAQDMVSKPVHDWVHHHHPDGKPFPINECPIGCTLGNNETVRHHRDLFFRKDNTPFHVSCSASPLVMNGIPVLKILEIRDITTEVEADRRKDEFLAMLAHELRNPLAPIAAAADLLKIGRLDDTGMKEASAVISRQVSHMTGLVNDLLDVSRVTRGLIELERECLDMRVIVSEAIEQVRPLIEARRHTVTLHRQPGPAMVFGDRKRLVQVVANLLNNAAKYTPGGGSITVGIDVTGDAVEVSVADNGVGMTPETIKCAFDLFVQAQRTPDRSQGGLGTGLALVRSLASLHDGVVTAHSDGPGMGSIFRLILPKHMLHIQARTDGAATEPVQIAARPLKVMVVDDSHDAAQMLGMLLTALGHQVRVECSSHAALEAARVEPQDVFLLDVGLPVMDGLELVYRIRQQPGNARALMIAVSGYGQPEDRRRGMNAGFDQYIVKPVTLQQISGLLKSLIDRPD